MNTLRQLAVHYRGAPSHERMPHPQPGAAPGQGSRPVLHLKPKKNAPAVQATPRCEADESDRYSRI
jgi:hypothetical protein